MADLKVKLTVRKSWLLHAGIPGIIVALCLMKLGAPSTWFLSVDVA